MSALGVYDAILLAHLQWWSPYSRLGSLDIILSFGWCQWNHFSHCLIWLHFTSGMRPDVKHTLVCYCTNSSWAITSIVRSFQRSQWGKLMDSLSLSLSLCLPPCFRVLGFNRVPPVVGRLINITTEVKEVTTDHRLSRTFFTSPGIHVCSSLCINEIV